MADDRNSALDWRPVAALAAGAAIAVLASDRRHPRRRTGAGSKATAANRQVVRLLTIDADPDTLARRWNDPHVLAEVMRPAFEVTPDGSDLRWRMDLPGLRPLEWRMIRTGSGRHARWCSERRGLIRSLETSFHPATGGRGTVMTVDLDIDPPLGAVGRAAMRLLGPAPGLVALGVLYRFRSLAQTGEIARTHPQPAGNGREA